MSNKLFPQFTFTEARLLVPIPDLYFLLLQTTKIKLHLLLRFVISEVFLFQELSFKVYFNLMIF